MRCHEAAGLEPRLKGCSERRLSFLAALMRVLRPIFPSGFQFARSLTDGSSFWSRDELGRVVCGVYVVLVLACHG
jgi:hypothetical protein